MAETVAVYIDYDNVSISLKENYRTNSIELLKKIREEINDNDNLRVMKAFCDFKHTKDSEILDLDSSLVELRHVSSSSSNGKTNASDIALAIDVTKSLFNKVPIDNYYIVSSDSDMFPILKELIFFNKKVHLIYLEANIGKNYMDAIKDVGIEATSIEEMLELEVYKPIGEELETDDELVSSLLIKVNEEITRIGTKFEKDGKKGTSSRSNILEHLEEEYPSADAKIILNHLEKIGYIERFENGKYRSFIVSDLGKELILSKKSETIIFRQEDFI